MPALLYASTVLLYVFAGRRRRGAAGHFSLGRWEGAVIAGALVWLAYELIILIGPSEFRDAQYYVLGALVLGLVVYVGQQFLEPGAMRTETGASGAAALSAVGQGAVGQGAVGQEAAPGGAAGSASAAGPTSTPGPGADPAGSAPGGA
jgi:hypothetical protein